MYKLKYYLRSVFILFILLHVSTDVLAEDVSKVSIQEKETKQDEIKFINLSDIPQEAAKALIEIKKLSKILTENKDISETNNSLISYSKAIDEMINDPVNEYLKYMPLKELRKKETEWSVYINQLSSWNDVLKDRIAVFDENKIILQKFSNLWSNTHINANKEDAPQAILEHITSVIVEIEKLRSYTKNRYDLLLTASNLITTKLLAIQEMENRIKEAILHASSKLFYQNQLPLNILFSENSFNMGEYFLSAYKTLLENMNEFIIYYSDRSDKEMLTFSVISVFIIVFVAVFNYLYRKEKLFVKSESYNKREYFFIGLPISTALAMILLANAFIFEDIPDSAKQFQLLFLLLPVFRIFQTLVSKKELKYFYIYFLLYFLSLIERNANGYELDARIFSLTLTSVFMIFIFYIIKDRIFDTFTKEFFLKYIYKMLNVFIVLLFISFIADIYGATLLASRITDSIFISLYSLMIFYVLTTVLTGYIIILLRRRISTSNMLDNFAKNIEKATVFFIKLAMTLWWFVVLSKAIGIYPYLITLKDSFLSLSWVIGNTTVSVQSIFDFFVIILGTWFLAKLTRTILEVEVFSRFKFPRGIPTAISTVLNYLIVISGTFIALSSLGISSEQFALVFGALGVGIGFGMRNIVANFISGIIMVFERPIQIGDTIEINKTMGKVQGIGTRSSTIKTFDGSEVIIPNADFIAKEITNWTLSDERRRKTLVFKVAIESDIRKVLAIMNEVSTLHPDVLEEPAPMATFLSFGEYYLEFKLYYWLHTNLIMAQSEITLHIYETLQKEGIKMALPKQEFIKNSAT